MEGEFSAKCRACGSTEPAIWDSDTGNAVCPSCGTVDDTQRLVSGEYYPTREQNAYGLDLFRPQGATSSYAVRIKGAEWHLQNHLREHRKLISNVCTSLEFHGSDRAIHHFEAAMANGDYRWGRESKLVCAVAIAISMVEEKKPEPIPRIAELIGEPPSAILRQWPHVTSTLDLHIRPTSPLLLLAMLHAYLQETSSPPSTLPTCILNNLSNPTFSLSSALSTAERIASFFALTNSFALLPSAPTTCGIFLVAIESEQGRALSLSTASAFADCLGRRFGVKGSTVLSRRRSMMMIFSEWATLLPWASVPTFTADGRNLWTVNKMSAIIRCVSDVLQFQYELSNRRGIREDDTTTTLNVNSHPVEGEEISSEPPSRASPTVENAPSPALPAPVWWTSLKSRKRPRGSDSAQRMIAMLLEPTSAQKLPSLSPFDDPQDVQERLSRIELQVLYPQAQYGYHPLSRLQALTLQRGGSDNIADDELFEPGELEGYRNNEEEVGLLGASHPEWDIVERRSGDDDTGNTSTVYEARDGEWDIGEAVEYGGGGWFEESHGGRSRSENQSGRRGRRGRPKVKRSKADAMPIQVNYSDDDHDGDHYSDDEEEWEEEGGDSDSDEYKEDESEWEDGKTKSMHVDGPARSLRASSGKRNRIAGTTTGVTSSTITITTNNGDIGRDDNRGEGDGHDDDETTGDSGRGDTNINGGGDGRVDTDGGDDTTGAYLLGKDAYLAFGIFPGWEGDDPDTVRWFGDGMEER